MASFDEFTSDMKNPLGLNQAEVIAGLALDLVKSSKRIISPITKQPFRVKFGKELLFFVCDLLGNNHELFIRLSFRSSRRWNCWSEKFSVLSLW